MDNLEDLLEYTQGVFDTNRIDVDCTDITNFAEYKALLDDVWGWDSNQTLFLFEGYYRRNERKINWG